MNIFKKISNVKYYIEYLTNQSQRIKDRDKLKSHIKMVNAFILLVNDIEFMLNNEISTNVMDRIILSRFYSDISKYYQTDKPVPVQSIFDNIISEMETPIEIHKEKIIEFFNDKHLNHIISKMPTVNTNNFIIDLPDEPETEAVLNNVFNTKLDLDNISPEHLNSSINKIKNPPTDQTYNGLINEFLERFKWNLNIIPQR